MSEFLSFDAFITPHIIRIVFALGFLLIALGALFRVVYGLWAFRIFGASSCRWSGMHRCAAIADLLRTDPGVLRYARQAGRYGGVPARLAAQLRQGVPVERHAVACTFRSKCVAIADDQRFGDVAVEAEAVHLQVGAVWRRGQQMHRKVMYAV